VGRLQANAYIKRFVSGKRRSRVQFKEELIVVNEFHEKLEKFDSATEENDCSSPLAMMNSIVKDTFRTFDMSDGRCGQASPAGEMASLFSSSGSWESAGGSLLSGGGSLFSMASNTMKAVSPLSQYNRGMDPPVITQ
jgi:hypothetical protein